MASKGSRKKGGPKAPPQVPRSEDPRTSSAAPASASAGAQAAAAVPEKAPSGSPVPPIARPWALLTLVLALFAGLGFATHLTHLHLQIHYGDSSFQSLCDVGSGFSCSEVNGSSYAKLFGLIPISLLAIPAYSVMLMLSLRGRTLRDLRSLGLVTVMGLAATVYSVYLFYISKFVIGSVCLFCTAMYAVNIVGLVMPGLAMGRGLGEMIRHGLGAFSQPRVVGLAALNAMLVSSLAWGAYTRTRDELVKQTAQTLLAGKDSKPATNPPGGKGATPASRPASPDDRLEVTIDETVPVKGAKEAKVTVVAYEDFQCGFCKRLSGNLEALVEKYPKDVRIAFRHFPMNQSCNDAGIKKSLHPDACRAAIASECARQQGQFWSYHDVLFKNSSNMKSQDLERYAEEVGLELAEFGSCTKDPATLEKIKIDSRTGGALDVSGTPAVFINGRRFVGAQSVEVMSALVDAELKGQTLTMAQLREVAEKPQEIEGDVQAPEMVRLQGPYGEFEIDSFESSIAGGKAVSKGGVQVATGVTWFDADKACRAAGKRLCTEAEWLTACSGAIPVDQNQNNVFTDDYVTGSSYPYGDYWKNGVCNDHVEAPKGATADNPPPPPPLIGGRRPACKSKFNVYDLTGNVREWVGTVPSRAAFMGGGFYSRDEAACLSRNESVGPMYKHEATGFRCCRGGNPPARVERPGREVGQKLSPFTATTLEGRKFSSDSFKGKVTLLTFWASWCGPCRKEMPAYATVYPELKARGFELVAVNVDREPEKARRFLEEVQVNYPVVMDSENVLLESFETRGMPTSFLIGKDGMILQRKTGFEEGDEKRLKNTVEKLLAQ